MTRQELVENFGTIGKKVPVSGPDCEEDKDDLDNQGSLKTAEVWEIWDKNAKKVRFVASAYGKGFLREVADPLSLSGFFPCPQQLGWLRKVGSLTPVAPYELYERQAEELNTITLRINRIIRVMKVRGAYDASVEGVEKVFELEDGVLTPIENVAAMQGGNGKLDSAIWLMPIEKLVAVLQQLYIQREQIKQIIFEITGLADVIRGASKASETLGAQQIKERWGGLRIRKMQGRVQMLVRSIIRAIVELAVQNLPVEQLYQMVQLQVPTAAQKAQMVAQLNMMQQAGKQPDPKMLAIVQVPTFEDALALLKDDLQRSFHIDIETNSTVDVEATEDMKLMSEFMTGTGQFISGISPLVVQGIMPFGAAQQMLLSMSRRLRFGPEVEEELNQMQAPKPPDDGKQEAQAKMQLDQQKTAGELAIKQKELQLRELEIALEKERVLLEKEQTSLERERVRLEGLRLQQDAVMREAEFGLEREKLQGEWREKGEERKMKMYEGEASRQAQVTAAGAPEKISQVEQQAQQISEALAELQGALGEVAQAVNEAKQLATSPRARKLERDGKGSVVSVDGLPVQRDEAGRLLGWG